ncbi:MAG: hypothetical protein V5A62_03080 [Haloarculaceae archaeon]
MRLVHFLVPSEALDTVAGVLDDEGVDCVVTDERGREGGQVVELPVPGGAVGTVEFVERAEFRSADGTS